MKMKDMEYWSALYKRSPEKYKEELCEFLYTPENEGQCDECPENRDMAGNGQLPCGQYHCWVTCHCSSRNTR